MAEPTFAQWRLFVRVARRGNLSAAAVDLDRTQSAVSHALRDLEQNLGGPLFVRHGRGVRLTQLGQTLLPLAEQLLAQVQGLHDAARAAVDVTGTVRIAAFPSLARHLLPGVLAALHRDHPALNVIVDDVHFDRSSVIDAVRAGRADIGLTQVLAGSGLTVKALGEDPYELVTPATWPLDDVWRQSYIHLGDPLDLLVPKALARYGVKVRPQLSLSSEGAIVALVERGLGFALLPRLTMPALPDSVVRHPLPWPVTRQYGAVTRPEPPGRPVQAILAALTISLLHPAPNAPPER